MFVAQSLSVVINLHMRCCWLITIRDFSPQWYPIPGAFPPELDLANPGNNPEVTWYNHLRRLYEHGTTEEEASDDSEPGSS